MPYWSMCQINSFHWFEVQNIYGYWSPWGRGGGIHQYPAIQVIKPTHQYCSQQGTFVSREFYICLSAKGHLIILWHHKLWSYSLLSSTTFLDHKQCQDVTEHRCLHCSHQQPERWIWSNVLTRQHCLERNENENLLRRRQPINQNVRGNHAKRERHSMNGFIEFLCAWAWISVIRE